MSKNKERNLKRKRKALSRQVTMLKKVGDQVYADRDTHDAALKEAETRGRDQAYEHCRNIVNEARNINSARAKMRDLVEGVADDEA